MRQAFIPLINLAPIKASKRVPATHRKQILDYLDWEPAEIIFADGGYRCFESSADATTWRNQR